jgi:hypothetical protein
MLQLTVSVPDITSQFVHEPLVPDMASPVPAMPPGEEAEIERSAHALFKVLDTDIDGKITEAELKAVRHSISFLKLIFTLCAKLYVMYVMDA